MSEAPVSVTLSDNASDNVSASVAGKRLVVPFEEVGIDAVAEVGGKNASLGEMIRELVGEGVRVPGGFATTAAAYRHHLSAAGLE
ncbi:MAG: PEP/pyruvate-binding domain-containing protein, partial [Cyanobacteriota bacterium]